MASGTLQHRPLLSMLAPLALTVASAHGLSTSDPPIQIDAVDLKTHARSGWSAANDGTTDASAGSWSGNSRRIGRMTRVVADQEVQWSDSAISGSMSAATSTRQRSAASESMGSILFTVPDRDRSRPDASWGYALPSALERLYSGTPPTCTAAIRCEVRCTQSSGAPTYRMDDPRTSSSAPKVIGLMILRSGVVVASCLVDSSEGVTDRTLEIDLELQPGQYELVTSCGSNLLGSAFSTSRSNVSMEYEIEFSNTGPGDGSYLVHAEQENYDLLAAGMPASYSWSTIPHDVYRSRSESTLGSHASASGVVNFQSGGLTGFRHLRVDHWPFPGAPESHSRNDLEMVFGLPHRMDVGIASLWYLNQEHPDRGLNDGAWTMSIVSLEDGSEVWNDRLTMDDVDFWSRFGEAEAWVNLEGGLYRLTINGEAIARQGDLNTGADLGFWFALSFEIP